MKRKPLDDLKCRSDVITFSIFLIIISMSQTISLENIITRTPQKQEKPNHMNEILYMACKDLIDDAKTGSSDMVFKEICLEILARAKNILTENQFRDLTQYTAERMKEKVTLTQATLP